jgi:hypothetical protein
MIRWKEAQPAPVHALWPARLQVAFSAAINSFITTGPGDVITNTTVLAQLMTSNGLWMPCATVFFPKHTTVLQQYLADTLTSDPNLVLPTSRWGSVRTSNIQIVQPAAPSSIAYTWRLGEFGGCNVLCGGGLQLRPVACMDSYHNPVDFSMCPRPQPAGSRYAVY